MAYMRAGIGKQHSRVAAWSAMAMGAEWAHGGQTAMMSDMYAEINMSEEVFAKDGVSFKVHTTWPTAPNETGDVPQMNSQGNLAKLQGGDSTSPWDAVAFSVREMYVSAKDYSAIPQYGPASVLASVRTFISLISLSDELRIRHYFWTTCPPGRQVFF